MRSRPPLSGLNGANANILVTNRWAIRFQLLPVDEIQSGVDGLRCPLRETSSCHQAALAVQGP